MNRVFYVGINGPKRVGKDYFADHLQAVIHQHYRLKCMRASIVIDRIADPLYTWAESVTGLPREFLMGPEKDNPLKESPFLPPELVGQSPRFILLDQGLHARQIYGLNFLPNCLKARTNALRNKLHDDCDLWVLVADIRMDDEATACHLTFELSRDGVSYEGTITEKPLTVPVIKYRMQDASENQGDPYTSPEFTNVFNQYLLPLIKDTP